MRNLERLQQRRQARRRRRLIRALSVVILVGIVLLLIGAAYMAEPPKVKAYEYQSCSTLWEFAEEYCPNNMDKRRYIDEVMRLNAMENCTVYSGRLYKIPVYE